MNYRLWLAASLLSPLAGIPAQAQAPAAFPTKAVRIVIPVPPGGTMDTLARRVAQELTSLWAQPVLVETRPGAGGVTAATAVARAAPDGYTIFMTDAVPLTVTPILHRDLPYDPVKDFVPVIALVEASLIVVVPGNSSIGNIRELIAAAKARPGEINYGSWGQGSSTHLMTEDFAATSDVRLQHIPYKGGADVLRALLSGDIQFAFTGLTATISPIKQGRLKAIAYAGPRRAPLLPDVPTVSESGLPGFQGRSWLGWVVPSGTPRAIVDKIASDTGRVISAPDFREKYIKVVGFDVFNLHSDGFKELLVSTRAKNEALLKRLKQ